MCLRAHFQRLHKKPALTSSKYFLQFLGLSTLSPSFGEVDRVLFGLPIVRVGRGPDLTHLVRITQNRTVDGKTENGQHQIEEKSIGKGFEVTRINEQAILSPDNCRSVCLSVCGSKSSIRGSWNCKGLICSYHQH